MRRGLLTISVLLMLPVMCFAQDSLKKHHKTVHRRSTDVKMPDWAEDQHYDAKSHVYFPDYYTFYDPVCGGYLFWDNHNFTFSSKVPAFMDHVDLRKTRIQILKGLSLDLYPELNYPYYMKMYPANHDNNMVPVPIPGNPAAR